MRQFQSQSAFGGGFDQPETFERGGPSLGTSATVQQQGSVAHHRPAPQQYQQQQQPQQRPQQHQQYHQQQQQQPQHRNAGYGGRSDVASEIKQLKQQVAALSSTVNDWHQVLSEITQSVFPIIGTCTVDNLPYYTEAPETRDALRAPIGHVRVKQLATLIYPQITRSGLLFMRIRTTCPRTGELQQYYVPVANQSMSPADLYEYTGVSSSAFEFFQGFHGPGEPNPGVESGDDVDDADDA